MFEQMNRVINSKHHQCEVTCTLSTGPNGNGLLTIREIVRKQLADKTWSDNCNDLRLVTQLKSSSDNYRDKHILAAVQDAFNDAQQKRDYQRTTIDCNDFIALLDGNPAVGVYHTEHLPADRERLMIDESDVDDYALDEDDQHDWDLSDNWVA